MFFQILTNFQPADANLTQKFWIATLENIFLCEKQKIVQSHVLVDTCENFRNGHFSIFNGL